MPLSFKQHIENLFKNSQTFSDSNKVLFIPKILEAIEKIDIELIKILKNDDRAKKHFFTQVDDIFVLNQNKLIEFFTLNDYMKNGSYTSYTNKIGLIKKDNFIKKFDDVVLAFPHKDCILEGGQTKDDDKKEEVFYNEILSSNEIDRLFEPKVLTNIKRYSKDEVQENCEIKDDDNLIIKGNNLIALHSLKKKYAGKVKLIYIDPPYNTGNDSFKYNDNFNHSTWLTFMKNRLEVAKEFLSDDGVIFVQCDDNEQAYLKVLMDEIFGRENFISIVTCKVKSAGGLTTDTEMFFDCSEYLQIYSKNINNLKYNSIKIQTEIINANSKTAKQYNSLINNINFDKKEFIVQKDEIKYYKIPKGNFNIETLSIKQMSEKDFFNKRDEIFRLTALSGGIGKKLKRHIEDFSNNEDLFLYEYTPSKGKDKGKLSQYLLYKNQTITMLNKLIYTDTKNQKIIKLEPVSNIITDDLWQGISNEGQIQFKNAKKPETLIKRILEIATNENDLIMDYHLGSGTTCAVAHKMGRRYIGIEQMDYIEDIAVQRLKKVIDGEQGGISKAVNWKGGGDFVYAELKQIDTFKDVEIGALNKNMQYFPISEIEDETYNVKKEEIEINKKFYGIENE
ncbi:hypothetical protein CRU94_00560 [Arcobacter sp. AHV-9/2010]|uniref:site-specific DNA-methyltransferase n=1 Tax=Arcobacter sp. AHV-9/2010 TaxID=2021861 RepID=UPI00100BCA9E|nr:site-specific DNA-methyltransferase [Arcobacter sp. CECT 9299]RXJ96643.1 hypothetical protein CRU94_00560 [Arcobacter sp. CECT 9299]